MWSAFRPWRRIRPRLDIIQPLLKSEPTGHCAQTPALCRICGASFAIADKPGIIPAPVARDIALASIGAGLELVPTGPGIAPGIAPGIVPTPIDPGIVPAPMGPGMLNPTLAFASISILPLCGGRTVRAAAAGPVLSPASDWPCTC